MGSYFFHRDQTFEYNNVLLIYLVMSADINQNCNISVDLFAIFLPHVISINSSNFCVPISSIWLKVNICSS